MQGTNALLIIVIGLIILYLAVTGRYKCLTSLFACFAGESCSCSGSDADKKIADAIRPLVPLRPLTPQ